MKANLITPTGKVYTGKIVSGERCGDRIFMTFELAKPAGKRAGSK
ncbi:MAG: hypothetical protein PHN84_14430 [Desulfuromonadaceae bacterium]|nr:hypothetical protein [Desulfuromonadaceae bacterium]